jgi:hypothetical protein
MVSTSLRHRAPRIFFEVFLQEACALQQKHAIIAFFADHAAETNSRQVKQSEMFFKN